MDSANQETERMPELQKAIKVEVMLVSCITGDGRRLTRYAIKRFRFFDEGVGDLTELWKEKHGHPLTARPQKRPKRFVAVPDGFKYCYGCESPLPRSEFSTDRSRKDGFNNRCRRCAARRWKDANACLCDRCGNECIGGTCRRCLSIGIAVRDAEWNALAIIPNLIYEAQAPLRAFIKELAAAKNLSPQARLQMLLNQINGN